MLSFLALLLLAVTLFVSTNLDDLLVLGSFLAQPGLRVRAIIAGQYTGIAILFGVALACSLLKMIVPAAWVGLLGIAPVLIGVKGLFALRHREAGESRSHPDNLQGNFLKQSAGVALVTVANGGDNLGIYIPAFAIHGISDILWIAIVFAVMTALWCMLASAIVRHPRLGLPIRRYGHILAPLVLIVIGVTILIHADTFSLLLAR